MSLKLSTNKKTLAVTAMIPIAAILALSSLAFTSAQTNTTTSSTTSSAGSGTVASANGTTGSCPDMGNATSSITRGSGT